MPKSRNEHFPDAEAVQDEVGGILRDTANGATNLCYLIYCDNDRTADEFKHDASIRFSGEIPSWAWAAHYADYALYVGSTPDLYARFWAHCQSDERGALFTGLFPPKSIIAVSQFDSPSQSMDAEAVMAAKTEAAFRDKYDLDDGDEVFVYQA